MAFWLLFALDTVFAAFFGFFFYSGVTSGAVASTALVVWSLIFFVLCGDLLAALALYFNGLQLAAIAVLIGFAFPAVIGALLMFGFLTF